MAALLLRQAPFIRLLFMLAGGILLQWYVRPAAVLLPVGIMLATVITVAGRSMQKWQPAMATVCSSAALLLLPLLAGMLLVRVKDVRGHPYWVGTVQPGYTGVTAVITEPLSIKAKTWKAPARIACVYRGDTCLPATGNCIIYIARDSTRPPLQYGSVIMFARPLQTIGNNGNPGAFDYQRNSLFKGITHQVFLQAGQYRVLPGNRGNYFSNWLFNTRDRLLYILKQYIPGQTEQGVAKALLIGYRDDLDKGLTEAYAGTGTIHVIAISGLHLGIIYLILLTLLKPIAKKSIGPWVSTVLVIGVLWLFTLLAGAGPSILRAAVMFSCITLGQSIGRNTSVYNTLAASAFILLCINPFNLWDVGFQLSYAAVLSILVFMQPVYRLFTIKNKWLNYIWKLNAVTISAQILTLPVIIFHFHQFPNLFLLTNLVAVPLSSIILGGELLLLVLSWLPPLAIPLGWVISRLIGLMNNFIQWCSNLPFAVTDNLQMNTAECWCLGAVITYTGVWLLHKHKKALTLALCCLLTLASLRLYAHAKRQRQLQLVVYNVPKQQAIDFIQGDDYLFKGDSIMRQNGFLQNFHLKPARIHWGIRPGQPALLQQQPPFYRLGNSTILVLDSNYRIRDTAERQLTIDAMVLSKNPAIDINLWAGRFTVKQVIADASNPVWKIAQWQKNCDSLGIPFHATVQKGAFILHCNKP